MDNGWMDGGLTTYPQKVEYYYFKPLPRSKPHLNDLTFMKCGHAPLA